MFSQPNFCTDIPDVQAEILEAHNAFRRAVIPTATDMLEMSWSNEVAASSQAWVDKCALTHGPPSSRMYGDYEMGENLFLTYGSNSWTEVVEAWHNEVIYYVYPNGSRNGQQTGHYTQVVWNSSYKIGCGVASCPDSVLFFGCQYYRAGNFRGVPPYTEGTPCADCHDSCVNNLCNNPCPYINKYANCEELVKLNGCSNALVNSWCPAFCMCATEIIPVGKK
ncbi:hypothetical protein DPEC_G00352040 [Dallia pectoralis]|uniref:Uncharacterized protein n=1 Tax=Dallia pectoralis TaxID=75939 RepID=A0ACC2F241_DALPE|nr:hypothetical protein DPEC_G00352040 [Dallia pectoralis]